MLDRHDEPRAAAEFAVDILTTHYDLDRPEPRASGRVSGRGGDAYTEMVGLVEALVRYANCQPDRRAAARSVAERFIASTGLDGVVSDPGDPDPLSDAKRYVDAAHRLLCRHRMITRGDLDAPF
jgi:hypothetical protein